MMNFNMAGKLIWSKNVGSEARKALVFN